MGVGEAEDDIGVALAVDVGNAELVADDAGVVAGRGFLCGRWRRRKPLARRLAGEQAQMAIRAVAQSASVRTAMACLPDVSESIASCASRGERQARLAASLTLRA